MSLPLVAVVGSPSVGKSTIFNRIIGEKKAIVEETRGVTRDRLYARTKWLTVPFNVVDTGGIEVENKPFQEQIRIQAQIAIDEADVVVFVVDGKIGLSEDDRLIAKMLQKANKKTILVVNKIDNIDQIANIYEFYALSLGDPIATSGEHGIGIGDLLDKIIELLPREIEVKEEKGISFSLIGRPNVGKSSLFNRLISQDRVIVSNIEGTTRDSIDTTFTYKDKLYSVIDTAGLKKRGKIYESVDKYAALRALRSIDKSDIALLLIDGKDGIREQDKHVVGYAIEAKKAIIVIINKCDLIEDLNEFKKEFKEKFTTEFKFLDYVPLIFISTVKFNDKVKDEIFKAIDQVYESYTFQIKTPVLNDIIQEAQMMNETPNFNGGRCRIYYAQQISSKPLTIALFVNEPTWMHFSYLRYLENRLRESFELIGSPINLVLRKRK